MNLAQVLKRKGKVCNSFQGQYIFGDTILLQAITPSAKIKIGYPYQFMLDDNVEEWLEGKKQNSPGINCCDVAQWDSVVILFNKIL